SLFRPTRSSLSHAGWQAARVAVQVSQVRPVGHGVVGTAAAHGQDRGRPHARPLDGHRFGGPRSGAADDPLGQDVRGPARVGGVRAGGWWVLYGLGSLGQDLPAYVVLSDPGGLPTDGPQNWSSGFLPAVYQGTPFRATGTPVANLASPTGVTASSRTNQLRFL